MEPTLRVLIIEDSEDDTLLTVRELKKGGLRPQYKRVDSLESLKKALSDQVWDLIIADYALPGFSGLDALKTAKAYGIDCPFIVVSGTIGKETAVKAMKAGAHDYIMKEHLTRLVPAVERELKESEFRKEKKIADQALLESEERFRDLVEKAGIAIIIDDEVGNIIFANEKASKLYGYSKRDMLKQSIKTLVHPDDFQDVIRFHEKRMSGETSSSNYEFRGMKKDGSVRNIELNATPLEKEGKIRGSRLYLKDITDRKDMEKDLMESEHFNKTIISSVEDGVVVYDAQFRYRAWNRFMEEITGISQKEVIGKVAFDVFPHLKEQGVDKLIKRALKGKTDRSKDTPYHVPQTGKSGWVVGVYSPHHTAEGEIIGVVASIRDITNRKKAEKKLKSSQEQLRNLAAHLQSAREQERAGIAREIHDELGQTLTALKMDLRWLEKRIPDKPDILDDKIIGMQDLIHKTIQDVKRISSELRPGMLDDLGLVPALEWQLSNFQERTGIRCNLTIDTEEIRFDNDVSTALFRIFQETLTNVVRHAQATKVIASLGVKNGNMTMKVKDNGQGITESELQNPKSFGLIGIKERVQFMHGKVKIKGVQGKGTTVEVLIPMKSQK